MKRDCETNEAVFETVFKITQIIFKLRCPLTLIGALFPPANYHTAKSPGEIFSLSFPFPYGIPSMNP